MARASRLFLREVHQRVVDTLYPCTANASKPYKQFVTQKANALLLDESSMDFFQQVHSVKPSLAIDAIQYVKAIIQQYKDGLQGAANIKRNFKAMIIVLEK